VGLRVRPRGLALAGLGWPLLWIALALLILIPMLCFLALAFSPALFAQGSEWLTLHNFALALRGQTVRALLNTLVVGVVTAVLAVTLALGFAWLTLRTDFGRPGLWSLLIWALLLMPSYFSTLGWQSVLLRGGILAQLGVDVVPLHDTFFGPVGIVWVLTTKGVPFAFLAVSAGLAGLGREFEDAARVHGASPWQAFRVAATILSPAIWSGLALVFAETISDFGVASTLASGSHFALATFTLYRAISTIPIRFPIASAMAWFLIGAVAVALIAQNRALRGRSFAVLSGRTRPVALLTLSVRGRIAAWFAVLVFFAFALVVPLFGAIAASFLAGIGGNVTRANLTLENYQRALTSYDLLAPMLLSMRLAAITATLAVAVGACIAWVVAQRRAGLPARLLELFLVAAVALPGIVLGAGYIFAYNLPIFRTIGFSLYGTVILLGMAYLAASLPATSRLLTGPFAQIQRSLGDAARVHGASETEAIRSTLVPLVARALLWAWLLSFTHVMLELPISQILKPPGASPLAAAIIRHLDTTDYTTGAAMLGVAALGLLAVIGVALAAFRLLAPKGWQRVRAR
jgi:iron(III) transport system permease protein